MDTDASNNHVVTSTSPTTTTTTTTAPPLELPPDLPEELRTKILDISGQEERIEIIKQYRKQQIIDMVCRQTTLTPTEAECFLNYTRGDIVSAIRLFMQGETAESLNKQKVTKVKNTPLTHTITQPKSINQKIYHELRHFMDKSQYKP